MSEAWRELLDQCAWACHTRRTAARAQRRITRADVPIDVARHRSATCMPDAPGPGGGAPDTRPPPADAPSTCKKLDATRPRPDVPRAPRRRAAVSSSQPCLRGERSQPPDRIEAWAAARRCRGAGHRWSHRSRAGWAFVRSPPGLRSDRKLRDQDPRPEARSHRPRGQSSRWRACPQGGCGRRRQARCAPRATADGPAGRARRCHGRTRKQVRVALATNPAPLAGDPLGYLTIALHVGAMDASID